MQKLYCYVDESGQDTLGDQFWVSVIVTGVERDEIARQLLVIERISGKGKVKWTNAKDLARFAYIILVLKITPLKGKLNYALFRNTTDYLPKTILATAWAITRATKSDNYRTTILVDGLPKSLTKGFGAELRHLRIRTTKVRGVRKEETDSLMRLADALCGFVRAATNGHPQFRKLLNRAIAAGFIKEL